MPRRTSAIPFPEPLTTAEVSAVEMPPFAGPTTATPIDASDATVTTSTSANNNNNNNNISALALDATPESSINNIHNSQGGEPDAAAVAAFLPNVVDATGVEVIESEEIAEQLLARKRRLFLILGACVCIAMALVIIIPLVTLNNTPPVIVLATPAPSSMPSLAPSEAPTLAPTTDRWVYIFNLVREHSLLSLEDGEEWWKNYSSAPYKAVAWLASDEQDVYTSEDESKLIQRFALATFYYSTSVPGSRDADAINQEEWQTCGPTSASCAGHRWLSLQDECTWHYIACQNGTDRVTEMNFPARGNNMHGTLPPQLSFLSHMQIFSAGNNDLKGGNRNDDNDNESTLHAIDRAFQGVSTLQVLTLFDNDFSGTLPTLLWQANPSLQLVLFNQNRFVGTMPDELFRATNLTQLQLQDNLLTGFIPSLIGSLGSSLQVLELDVNQLSGSLPNELYDLTVLTSLKIFNNTQLTGSINTDRIQQLSSLQIFSAGHTQLGGTLPETMFASLTDMRELKVEHASFDGTLSEEIAQWHPTLEVLWLHENRFTGTLPEALDNLTHLKQLRLEGNGFVGTISQTVCEERGHFFRELSNLTVDCEIACTCCDYYCQ